MEEEEAAKYYYYFVFFPMTINDDNVTWSYHPSIGHSYSCAKNFFFLLVCLSFFFFKNNFTLIYLIISKQSFFEWFLSFSRSYLTCSGYNLLQSICFNNISSSRFFMSNICIFLTSLAPRTFLLLLLLHCPQYPTSN